MRTAILKFVVPFMHLNTLMLMFAVAAHGQVDRERYANPIL